jgi:hypothetical protein
MNNWIKSAQNGALVNLDNLADMIVKEVKGGHQVLGYTSSGFGIVIFKGTEDECADALHDLEHLLQPVVI